MVATCDGGVDDRGERCSGCFDIKGVRSRGDTVTRTRLVGEEELHLNGMLTLGSPSCGIPASILIRSSLPCGSDSTSFDEAVLRDVAMAAEGICLALWKKHTTTAIKESKAIPAIKTIIITSSSTVESIWVGVKI